MGDFFIDYFRNLQTRNMMNGCIHSCPELMECIQQLGFLPLLDSGIPGFCAEEMMSPECRYTRFNDGSWEWPLWEWKSAVVTEGRCVYGKFFSGKAGFVSQDWWPDLYNWRRSQHPVPEQDSTEGIILTTLREHGNMIARDLRATCNLTGRNMRSRFDAIICRMQMDCLIVTEDFVYPTDKHGRKYGFGWSLLTTPERLLGRDACQCNRTPEESFNRMYDHLANLHPYATEKQIKKLIK